jgi:hypothetical protein
MALYFQNLYANTVWIAFLYGDQVCGRTPFRKLGWWGVPSGQSFGAWNTDLRNVNRYAAFYAEEYKDSQGATWSGTGNNWYLIPDGAFNQCYDDNANCNQQPDFVPLDFSGSADVIVVLGPAAGLIRVRYGTLETGWRWCHKCQVMFYPGFKDPGWGAICPADYRPHDGSSSANYAALVGEDAPGQQGNWRHCLKCQGIYFGPGENGVCPSDHHPYHPHQTFSAWPHYAFLTGDDAPGQQGNWRWCHRCGGMFFNGNPSKGVCPAPGGGPHDASRSGRYTAIFA